MKIELARCWDIFISNYELKLYWSYFLSKITDVHLQSASFDI